MDRFQAAAISLISAPAVGHELDVAVALDQRPVQWTQPCGPPNRLLQGNSSLRPFLDDPPRRVGVCRRALRASAAKQCTSR